VNRRDVIFFALAGAAVLLVALVGRKGGTYNIGRVGGSISLGGDGPGLLASAADAVRSAAPAPSATPAPSGPPSGAFQIGTTWYTGDSMGRPRVWIPPRP